VTCSDRPTWQVKAAVESPLHAAVQLAHVRARGAADDGVGAAPSPARSGSSASPQGLLDGSWASSWNQHLAGTSSSVYSGVGDTADPLANRPAGAEPEPTPDPHGEPRRCASAPAAADAMAGGSSTRVYGRPTRLPQKSGEVSAPVSAGFEVAAQGEGKGVGELEAAGVGGERNGGEGEGGEGEGRGDTDSTSDATSDSGWDTSTEPAQAGKIVWAIGRRAAAHVKRNRRCSRTVPSRSRPNQKLDGLSEQVALVLSLQQDILARLYSVEKALESHGLPGTINV
jgi:hypothetical protein